ncbi:hypothetical protein [Gemmatimonas aurantiaca]|uniref:hypothetical protein n=1 Tax=Gemmatimonas aurantiaca TaxID=173480 RepID=UPI00301DF881
MTTRPRTAPGLFLVFSAILGGGVSCAPDDHAGERREPVVASHGPSTVAPDDLVGDSIPAEAYVFRTSENMLAIGDVRTRRREAHPRSLKTYRLLRAYPGAPPRIPHGLTPQEFRENACRACHERGGFSIRFNAYVPVTPHPEMGACLQCHVGDARLMAIPLPNTDPSSRCHQCHNPSSPRPGDREVAWQPLAWPTVQQVMPGQLPPPIPHDSPMRVNCLACHSGPSSIAEIRTSHPERANCRQCHVQGTAVPDGGSTAP